MGELVNLLNALSATIASLQTQLADAQAALDLAVQEAYNKGFADGVASVPPSDKLFNQAEVDAMLLPLNEKIALLEAQVAEMPALIEAAVNAKLVEVVADYEASQVDDAAFLAKYKK